MNIDEMTYRELKQIAALFQKPEEISKDQRLGFNIVVLDRGWVHVGECRFEGEFLIIENAKNIRQWGTTKGLGELVNGPTSSTKLDDCGTVKVNRAALKFLIPCGSAWS